MSTNNPRFFTTEAEANKNRPVGKPDWKLFWYRLNGRTVWAWSGGEAVAGYQVAKQAFGLEGGRAGDKGLQAVVDALAAAEKAEAAAAAAAEREAKALADVENMKRSLAELQAAMAKRNGVCV